ncbi:epidermal differentiation-specific protein-like [Dryobates pubescens]|uniref:epidermal differentiation-specific protein-like n=1 Tax=Dryobates pubescens TaxID=118200 RepID=UPI0023B9B590|nr:epidermal differentiation-specific protein-like [Dryobates pubescens]
MNRITVYERDNFEGLSREFTCDVPDLHELDFGNCIASLKVVGQPWIAYTVSKYEGESHVFEEGEYPSVERPNSFSALRLVHHDLGDPQIILYEQPNFQGACKVVTEETNLAYGYFNDRVASHVVQRGVWLLYQHPGRGGWHCLAWPVQKGRSESSTRRQRVEVQLPAKIPPHTALSIHILRKEVTLSVPVLLTITQNEAVSTEMGEYRSVSGTNISARYSLKPLPAAGREQTLKGQR